MTTPERTSRCSYCGRPKDYQPRPGEGQHNQGCPLAPEAGPEEMRQWNAGYEHGFECDTRGRLPWWVLREYHPAFQFGYDAGEAEIDRLVDEASQSNYTREY